MKMVDEQHNAPQRAAGSTCPAIAPAKSSITLERPAEVIVLGNVTGGWGKSTAAMHLIVALLRDGYRAGAIDFDARQSTIEGYFAARQAVAAARGIALPLPRRGGGR